MRAQTIRWVLLLVQREARLVSNLVTGTQFLRKESNPHFHLHMACIKVADSTFTRDQDLTVPDDVKIRLTGYQKVHLLSCF